MSILREMCAGELAKLVQGELQLGTLPPIGGAWEPVRRCVTRREEIQPGDVVFTGGELEDGRDEPLSATECFARGALGVVVAGDAVEPWAGRFCIHVSDTAAALWEVASRARCEFGGRVVVAIQPHGVKATNVIGGGLQQRLNGPVLHATTPADAAVKLLEPSLSADFALLGWSCSTICEIQQLTELIRPDIAFVTATKSATNEGFLLTATSWLEALDVTGMAVLDGDNEAIAALARETVADAVVVGSTDVCDLRADRIHAAGGRLSFELAGQRITSHGLERSDLPTAAASFVVLRSAGIVDSEAALAVSNWQLDDEQRKVA